MRVRGWRWRRRSALPSWRLKRLYANDAGGYPCGGEDVQNAREGAPKTSLWDVDGIIAQNVSLTDVFDKPFEPPSSLPRLVDELRNHKDAAVACQCIAVLLTILGNILKSPFDTTKRSLKTTTSVFCTKIAPVPLPSKSCAHAGFSSPRTRMGMSQWCQP
ncbi:hypothetical protein C3747_7g181 [Trypanosoma cruzi]|uniref:Uncharacterized protein n=1 Tax=Trypanosoma cruzi TaxID=5693 RepID=A0A2V2XI71_TRYCR|nr:hypothetical protein C3747_7g181 [Trypanosoma cruzi]